MRKKVLWLLFLCLLAGTVQAQVGAPLIGPLIAYTTALQDRVLLYDAGTGERRSVSFGDGWQQVWGFSADGCRLLGTMSDGPGPARLYSMRLDGGDARQLVDFGGDTTGAWEPAWSPDGTRITFTLVQLGKTRSDGGRERQYRLAWIDAAGGQPQFYTPGDAHEPAWSPDGKWLAYVVYDNGAANVWAVSADGQTPYRLTNFSSGAARTPRWSPDSELISFTYAASNGNDQFWMIANQSGAIATQLSSRSSLILDTTWFPDSTAILASARDFRDVTTNVLWRISLLGNADATATRYLDDPKLVSADFPRFSPDGKWLALRSAYNLTLVDVASQTWKLADDQTIGNTPPVWSPAGFKSEAAC
jgi:Tol biopolymer transport system component